MLFLRKIQSLKLYLTTKRNGNALSSSVSPQQSLHDSSNIQRMEGIRIIGPLTITVVLLLTTLYRLRHSMSNVIRTAVTLAIWEPIQEIIQAIRHQ